MFKFTTDLPLSVYIHLPWCVRKCPYCDFNSHEAKSTIPEGEYVSALLSDLEEQWPKVADRSIVSLFFGGGTPSLFSPGAIQRILEGIHAKLPFDAHTEVTLEANPGTVDEARFKGFRAAGVNRLSIGIQSLQNEKLAALGRIHNREYALRAIDAATNAGFENFNLDLMHGLPEQSLEDAVSDLNDALSFSPPHLSWYQLTLEPNTLFFKKPPVLPVEEVLDHIQEEGKIILESNGLKQYEVSAYARNNKISLHNTHYWEFGDYLGLGAGAHSKITDHDKQHIVRHWQVKHPNDYLNPKKSFVAGTQILSAEDARFEFMLNTLRLIEGVPASLFTERTGLPLSFLEPIYSTAQQKGLLVNDRNKIAATPLGQRFLNELIGMFLKAG